MSLYNQMCGNNPLFGIFARVIETAGQLPPIPRFRDAYTREVDGKAQVVIYTRTGGGNRQDYESQNEAITAHPLYVENFDDDFDSTFAHWAFRLPDQFADRFLRLHRAFCKFPKGQSPKQKFDRSMNALKGDSAPEPEPTAADIDEFQDAVQAILDDLPKEPSSLEKSQIPQTA